MNTFPKPYQPVEFIQVQTDQWTRTVSGVITETQVALTVNGETWFSFMCTPTDLEALAVGFLFNEGLIDSIEEVVSARVCPAGDNVDVWLTHSVEKPTAWSRTSGCTGGVTAVENQITNPSQLNSFSRSSLLQPVLNGKKVSCSQIQRLIENLFESQDIYKKSGGVHTSVLSNGEEILAVAEDIGRHNTLDKIAGKTLFQGIKRERSILLSTGRISSEMLQKAYRLGAFVVISRTSPSSLSLENAIRLGITLIGYARRNQFRVYTHPERILEYDLYQKDKD